jgi:hypothetical protein
LSPVSSVIFGVWYWKSGAVGAASLVVEILRAGKLQESKMGALLTTGN